MKIALDIGGVISKWPATFISLMESLRASGHDIYIITDMHSIPDIIELLRANGITEALVSDDKIYSADYTNHGELSKAILLKQLSIDIFIDDFIGYVQWDSKLGPAPIRLLMAPDPFRPYWHDDWKVKDNFDFGRRKTSMENLI